LYTFFDYAEDYENFPEVFEKIEVIIKKSQQQKIQGSLLGFSTFYPHLKCDRHPIYQSM